MTLWAHARHGVSQRAIATERAAVSGQVPTGERYMSIVVAGVALAVRNGLLSS